MMLERVIAKLKNKRIVVLGAGLTGMSCVRFLAKHQISCQVNDSREGVTNKDEFNSLFPNCDLSLGQWRLEWVANAEVVITSPGIDLEAEKLSQVISEHAELIGDIELFSQITDKPILAVTGSNGKSTVVSLLAHIGRELGFNIGLGGNIGLPVLDQLDDDIDCYVLELSSFQLETLSSLKAVASSVLNVSDDHLDRHKTLGNYSRIKQVIYSMADTAVINRDDPKSFTHLPYDVVDLYRHPNICSFGSDKAPDGHFGLTQENEQYYLCFGNEKLISLNELPLAGTHNALNYLAALALGHCNDWSLDKMVKSLASFSGLAHRCQRVETTDGICWVNDSKATNVGAALAAIKGLSVSITKDSKLILLAGGDGKGADFAPLIEVIEQNAVQVFAIGKDAEKLAALSEKVTIVDDLKIAVKQARDIANIGDVVLLSPACASIDMFKNFAERGQLFVDAVQELQEAS